MVFVWAHCTSQHFAVLIRRSFYNFIFGGFVMTKTTGFLHPQKRWFPAAVTLRFQSMIRVVLCLFAEPQNRNGTRTLEPWNVLLCCKAGLMAVHLTQVGFQQFAFFLGHQIHFLQISTSDPVGHQVKFIIKFNQHHQYPIFFIKALLFSLPGE